MIFADADAEQSTMSTTENNWRRIERMDTWISHAEAASGDDDTHLRFLFYWIAYEAAYQTHETGEAEKHGERRRELHWKLARHDRGKLQSILRAQSDNIVCILELRQADPSFWKKWEEDAEVETPEAWEIAFGRRVGSAKKRLNEAVRSGVKKAISATLDNLFRNLNVVRVQIVHGASAGLDSHGRTQVILGAKLLKVLLPCFRGSIESNIKEDWGAPPYPRVGRGRDDKCPPPWLSRTAGSNAA